MPMHALLCALQSLQTAKSYWRTGLERIVPILETMKKTVPVCDDGCSFQDRVCLARMHRASHSICSVTLQLMCGGEESEIN